MECPASAHSSSLTVVTEPTTTVRLNPPPPTLMRLINPVVRRVLSTPVLARRISRIALVEFHGRRTGRRLRVPMGLHDIDGVPTAFTSRQWRLNFIERAPVMVTCHGRPHPGTALLVDPAPRQVGQALRKALDNGASAFDLGLKIDKRHEPTVDELDAASLEMIQFLLNRAEKP
jgi:hypothetical protein